jgi:1-acyl-sn-glycerol-3-phosphate acyltransferase
MAALYQVPLSNRIARSIMRPFFRAIFHILSDVHIEGLANVPATGAYLIAINHVSLYEAPFILAFWPIAPEAVGAVDIWSRPGQSLLARWYGGIPVHRGEYDRQLLETMVSVLRSGRSLLIAPEGGRSHTPGMRRALPGVAYVVDRARVPVIPVGITGTTDDFLQRALHGERPRLEIRIGPAIYLPPIAIQPDGQQESKGEARRISRQRNVDQIMLHIAEQLPEEYRGFYASSEPVTLLHQAHGDNQ